MRRLAGAVPRAFPDHRTAVAAAYGRYCRAIGKGGGGRPPGFSPGVEGAVEPVDGRVDLERVEPAEGRVNVGVEPAGTEGGR